MAVRDKAGLEAQLNAVLASGQTPPIEAARHRQLVQDLIDSLSLQASFDALIARVAALENLPPGSGISLAQAIAAVQVDQTAVSGVELIRTADATSVVIGLTTPAVTHLNYVGLSADDAAQAAEFTVSGMNHALQVPVIPAGQTRFIIYAKPQSEGPFTFAFWYVPGSPNAINVFGTSFVDGAGIVQLGGESHVWIRSRVALPQLPGGRTLEAG